MSYWRLRFHKNVTGTKYNLTPSLQVNDLFIRKKNKKKLPPQLRNPIPCFSSWFKNKHKPKSQKPDKYKNLCLLEIWWVKVYLFSKNSKHHSTNQPETPNYSFHPFIHFQTDRRFHLSVSRLYKNLQKTSNCFTFNNDDLNFTKVSNNVSLNLWLRFSFMTSKWE